MRITIEDLEALKELSDELEENHVETEKQLYEDIGMHPKFSNDVLTSHIFWQNNVILKFVNTSGSLMLWKKHVRIMKARSSNSVTLLCNYRSASLTFAKKCFHNCHFEHSDLDQLRTQSQTAQTESATAVSQAATVMSLNLKLQSSVQKHQARTIDLEVKSLEAKECKELLDIVQV